MIDGFDDPELYRPSLGVDVLAILAAIAVMLWPMDERPAARGHLRWLRR